MTDKESIDMDIIPEFFTCKACWQAKPLEDFYRNKNHRYGYATSRCKRCLVSISVEKAKTSTKIKKYKAAWYQENKDRLSKKAAAYREANKAEI